MNKTFIFSLFAFFTLSFQAYAADIAGTWKTIDDKTGYARAEVKISKLKDGSCAGKIIKIHAIPNRPAMSKCEKCEGNLKNAPLLGLAILSGFEKSASRTNEYTNEKIIDPLSGTTLLGRTVSWIRID